MRSFATRAFGLFCNAFSRTFEQCSELQGFFRPRGLDGPGSELCLPLPAHAAGAAGFLWPKSEVAFPLSHHIAR